MFTAAGLGTTGGRAILSLMTDNTDLTRRLNAAFVVSLLPPGARSPRELRDEGSFVPDEAQLDRCLLLFDKLLSEVSTLGPLQALNMVGATELTLAYLRGAEAAGLSVPEQRAERIGAAIKAIIAPGDPIAGAYRSFDGVKRLRQVREALETLPVDGRAGLDLERAQRWAELSDRLSGRRRPPDEVVGSLGVRVPGRREQRWPVPLGYTLVGSAETCHVVVPNAGLAPQHALIHAERFAPGDAAPHVSITPLDAEGLVVDGAAAFSAYPLGDACMIAIRDVVVTFNRSLGSSR